MFREFFHHSDHDNAAKHEQNMSMSLIFPLSYVSQNMGSCSLTLYSNFFFVKGLVQKNEAHLSLACESLALQALGTMIRCPEMQSSMTRLPFGCCC